jgi:heptosyltransferase-2
MKPASILVRGVNWLGDAVMSTPALRRLREAQPDARIVLLTADKLHELWRDHPALDEVVTFSSRDSVFKVGRRLRELNCDTALILPNSPRSALECWLAKVPRRIGYLRPWRGWALTDKVAPRAAETGMERRSAEEVRLLIETGIALKRKSLPPEAHQLHQYLELAAVLGARREVCPPQLQVNPDEASDVCARFGAEAPGARTKPLVGINAGAEYGPAKRWPRERFVEMAVAFNRQHACNWWVFGGPNEVELADAIAAAIRSGADAGARVECLAGRTSLRDLCAASKAVDVLVTNDTGPMHVAAAVGTPVIALFGSTSPELTGPGLPGDSRHQLIREAPACAPCFQRECPIDFRCMTGITVDRVVKALAAALQKTQG